MKVLLIWIAVGISPAARSQQNPIALRSLPQQAFKVSAPTGSWIDTTNLYPSKYGQVARLTGDNMPCILPYKNAKTIPNPARDAKIPSDIPNAWTGSDKKTPKTAVKTTPFSQKPHSIYTKPFGGNPTSRLERYREK